MKYRVLGLLSVVLLHSGLTLAQTGKAGKPDTDKNGTRHKTPAANEAPAVTPKQDIVIIPSWLPPDNPVQPAATVVTNVLDTKLDVRFDWAKQWLLGTATLTLRPHFYPQNQVVLDAKGFEVKSVRLLVNGKEKNLTYAYDKQKLTITLDRSYPRTEAYQVRISYVAKPNELPASGSAAITSNKGLYFINPLGTDKNKPRQIWTQGETEANSAWFPTIDKPNQRMTQEIALTVEDKFRTMSNGLLISSRKNADGTRTDVWKQALPAAPYLTMLAVGEFAVVSDTWRGKSVEYFVDPPYSTTAKAVFGHTPEMLEFFSTKLGVEFPWEKYAQVAVHDFVSGAMENTTASTFQDKITQFTPRELLDITYEPESVVAHELFHQWFGDYVTSESWSNLPLNEAFADYSEFLWAEHKYGPAEAALVQQKALMAYLEESQTKREPLIRYHYADREDMFDRHSYSKGGRVLHMLRQYVGDEAFFASLNRYLTRNKLSSVEIAELRLAFEEVTGEDLMWFFDQWFLKRGHPELQITHSYAGNQVALRVRQVQDSTFSPIYQLPVTVTTWVNNQPVNHRITVTKADQTFALPVSQRPALVKFDATGQLLAEIEEERSTEELLYQFYHAQNFLQKYEAITLLRGKTMELPVSAMLRNALSDDFWAVRQTAVEALRRYKGSEGTAIRKDLQKVAANDPKTQVRAAAINSLASFQNEDYGQLYTAALTDSSYAVASAAVNALAKAPTVTSLKEITALQETKNAALIDAVSNYFALNGTADQYEWFLRRSNDVRNEALYQFLQNFATLMLRMPPVERDKGIARLETIARSYPNQYARLGAYKGLSMLVPSSPNVKLTLQDIRSREKDKNLATIYTMLQ
ncbi:M1 family metallopeptidase [Hymenobacter profundi]|uniref:M1 family metallopeptidase n=1 Tax=Hymenobacter profundi TaxID=1982110 RepID=A0ABS6WV99_9BACT|nr:M1 family metallopeptidase [Hymenobacter profundi]MBW3127548.1 M1 family metallopeptidase [Hymenobacter profundi]